MEGMDNIIKILDGFKDGYYKNYKFLDILTCKGGCINGPSINYRHSINERIKRVRKYRNFAARYEKDLGKSGKKADAEGIDFGREFV